MSGHPDDRYHTNNDARDFGVQDKRFVKRLCQSVLKSAVVVGLIGGASICVAADEPFTMPLAPFHSEGRRISADQRQLEEVVSQVSSALNEGNVDALNKLTDALLRQKTLTPAGYLPLSHFHTAMRIYLVRYQPKTREEVTLHTFDRTLSTVHAWQKQHPESGTAIVAEADVFLRAAFTARGNDASSKVPAGRWKVFEQGVAAAHEALIRNEEVGKQDPIWYEKMASVMRDRNANRHAYVAMIDEGMRAYPSNLGMANSGLKYMLPRWGGSDEEVVAYIRHVLSNASANDAPIVAANIYYFLLSESYYDGIKLAYLLHISSAQIEEAMAAQVARFPDPVNVDAAAVVACSLGDKSRLRPLLAEIGDSPIIDYWGDPGDGSYFSLCRRFLVEGADR
jgi:hypothetical protein